MVINFFLMLINLQPMSTPPNIEVINETEIDRQFLSIEDVQALYVEKGDDGKMRPLFEECVECKDLNKNQEVVAQKGNYLLKRSYQP